MGLTLATKRISLHEGPVKTESEIGVISDTPFSSRLPIEKANSDVLK